MLTIRQFNIIILLGDIMSDLLNNETYRNISKTDKSKINDILRIMIYTDHRIERNIYKRNSIMETFRAYGGLYNTLIPYENLTINKNLFKFEYYQKYWIWLVEFENKFLSDYYINAKTLINYIRQSNYELFNMPEKIDDNHYLNPFEIWESMYSGKILNQKNEKVNLFSNILKAVSNKEICNRTNLFLNNMYKLENKLNPLFDIRFLKLRNQKPGNYIVSYKDWYIFSLFYIYQEGLNVKEYTKKGNKSDGKKSSKIPKFNIKRSCSEDSFKSVMKNVLRFINIYIKEPGSIFISQLYRVDNLFKIFKMQTMTKYFLVFQEDKFLSLISKSKTEMEDDEKNFILTTLKYSVFYDYNFITKCLCSNCKNPFYVFGMFTYLCFYNEEEEDSKEEEDNKTKEDSWLNYKNVSLTTIFEIIKENTIIAIDRFSYQSIGFDSSIGAKFDDLSSDIKDIAFFKHMEKDFVSIRKKIYENETKETKDFLNNYFNTISDVNLKIDKNEYEDFICYKMARNGYYLDNDVLRIYLEEIIKKYKDPVIINLAKNKNKWTNVHIKEIKDYMSYLVKLQCTNLPRSYFKKFDITEDKFRFVGDDGLVEFLIPNNH